MMSGEMLVISFVREVNHVIMAARFARITCKYIYTSDYYMKLKHFVFVNVK